MKITNTIEIKAPASKVFYWLEDPERAMKWMTSVSRSETIEETPEKVGTTFREYVEEGGRGLEMRGVITAWEKDSRLAFRLESDFNISDIDFSLNEKNGITLLTQSAELQFKGALKFIGLLFASALVGRIKSRAQAEFLGLKKLCESDE